MHNLKAMFEMARVASVETDPDGDSPGGSGEVPLTFDLDERGNYSDIVEADGGGVRLDFSLVIESPAAVYNVEVHSSDGGGGRWYNVGCGEPCTGTISTSVSTPTVVRLSIHANVRGMSGVATLFFSFQGPR